MADMIPNFEQVTSSINVLRSNYATIRARLILVNPEHTEAFDSLVEYIALRRNTNLFPDEDAYSKIIGGLSLLISYNRTSVTPRLGEFCETCIAQLIIDRKSFEATSKSLSDRMKRLFNFVNGSES
jgi:hypothetical protein